MIRVLLPTHLSRLVGAGRELTIALEEPATVSTLLDALEARYPVLHGTIRDHASKQRRPYIRFFACGEDWSHHPLEESLPAEVLEGRAPFMIIGAMAGG